MQEVQAFTKNMHDFFGYIRSTYCSYFLYQLLGSIGQTYESCLGKFLKFGFNLKNLKLNIKEHLDKSLITSFHSKNGPNRL